MILITGATGNVGSEVLRQLVARGAPVRALVRNPQKAQPIQELGVEVVVGDLAEPDTLAPALEGVSHAFLLSAVDPRQAQLQGQFIEVAQQVSQPHIVKLSALGTRADSPVPGSRLHWQTEQQLIQSGLAYTILRPNAFMQFLLALAPSVTSQGAFYLPMKDGRTSIVDVRDIAAVAVAALTEAGHVGKIYEITGPEALSYNDIAQAIGTSIGKPVTYVDVPPEASRQSMIQMGFPEWAADNLLAMYSEFSASRYAQVSPVVAEVTHSEPRRLNQFLQEVTPAFLGSGGQW